MDTVHWTVAQLSLTMALNHSGCSGQVIFVLSCDLPYSSSKSVAAVERECLTRVLSRFSLQATQGRAQAEDPEASAPSAHASADVSGSIPAATASGSDSEGRAQAGAQRLVSEEDLVREAATVAERLSNSRVVSDAGYCTAHCLLLSQKWEFSVVMQIMGPRTRGASGTVPSVTQTEARHTWDESSVRSGKEDMQCLMDENMKPSNKLPFMILFAYPRCQSIKVHTPHKSNQAREPVTAQRVISEVCEGSPYRMFMHVTDC